MGKLRLGSGSALALTLNRIKLQDNVDATAVDKGKDLHKWGHNQNTAADTWETVRIGGGVETMLTANSITVIDSTSASDTGTVAIEGHYLDASNNLVFHVQSATLTGVTAVTLSQPLARCSRLYITTSDAAVGSITVNAGEGGTAYATIAPLHSINEKAATSTSYRDYFVLQHYGSSILGGNNASVSFRLQMQTVGGAALTHARWACKGDNVYYIRDLVSTPIIVPPNTDFRIQSNASLAGTEATAHFGGDFVINKAYINDASPAPA